MRITVLYGILLLWLAPVLTGGEPPTQPSRNELLRSVKAIKADSRCPELVHFVSASPADPLKQSALGENQPSRTGFTLRDPVARRIYEVFTNTSTGAVVEWRRVDDVESVFTQADRDSAEMVVRKHAPFMTSLKRRGIDSADVYLDLWPSQIPRSGFRFRSTRVIAFEKGLKGARDYSRPIEGLVCTVNLDARRVFEFYDKDAGPVLTETADQWKLWTDAKKQHTLTVGASSSSNSRIRTNKGTVTWKNWSVSPRLHADEGLVMHNVEWKTNNGPTSIASRLSMGELLEINASASTYWNWRHPLLVGELGLGSYAVDQQQRVDIPRYSKTLAAASVGAYGTVQSIANAIACYEDADALVIKSTFRIAHREIAQVFKLHGDGTIDINVEVGGIEAIQAVADSVVSFDTDAPQSNGALLLPHRLAPLREYVACFRLDMDVNGVHNTVSEVDLLPAEASANPYRQTLTADVYPLYREVEAQRLASPLHQRQWRIVAEQGVGGLQAGYTIEPQAFDASVLSGTHMLDQKAAFATKALWVTRNHDNELKPVAVYPAQTVEASGLPVYVQDNEAIRDQDIVVWATARKTHVPRRGAGLLMRPLTLSVRLVPDGFGGPQ